MGLEYLSSALICFYFVWLPLVACETFCDASWSLTLFPWFRSCLGWRCNVIGNMAYILHVSFEGCCISPQAVCGCLRPGAGSERATHQRGPAGVSWWDEGQLQGPDQGAVKHHAWTGRNPKDGNEMHYIIHTTISCYCIWTTMSLYTLLQLQIS